MGERFQRVTKPETSLALAVKPIDAVTGAGLRHRSTVTIDGVEYDPILNPSGYWLFLSPPVSLPDDPVTIRISAGPEYVPVVYRKNVDGLSPRGFRLEVFPSVSYPFVRETTIVQGEVVDADGDPVFGATVSIEHAPPETRTDEDGTFALVVDGIVAKTDDTLDSPLRAVPVEDDDGENGSNGGDGENGSDGEEDGNGEDGDSRKIVVKPEDGPEVDPKLVVSRSGSTVTVEQKILEGERTIRSDPIQL